MNKPQQFFCPLESPFPLVRRQTLVITSLIAVVSFLWIQGAQATDISGTISSTLIITANSKLTGDVTCTVTGAPRIQFGAPGIKLNLNGHTMTGNGSRNTCTFSAGEDGIFTNGENAVSIEGPGIVRRFRQRGVDVTGNNSIVKQVTVLSSCLEGILVGGTHNRIEDNSVARASLAQTSMQAFGCKGLEAMSSCATRFLRQAHSTE